MAKSSIEKTNVMRLLGQKKVPYTPHTYPHGDDAVDGVTVAQMTGMDPAKVFKTLVARGASKTPYVFVIPVARELDLKKAAKAVGEKSIAMLHVSELTPLTGYVRGGCSPVGMKKPFPTFFDETALQFDFIYVSGGQRGLQIKIAPETLIAFVGAKTLDLTKDTEEI